MQELSFSDLLPAAVGIALSPLPVAAVILMLFSTKARTNGVAFLAGWVTGLAVVGAVVLLNGDAAGSTSEPTQGALIVQLLLGLLLLAGAAKQWTGFRNADAPPEMPKWMRSIDDFSAGKAFLVAALLSGVNPKNLALNVSGVVLIAQAQLPDSTEWAVLALFILLASLTVAIPVIYYLMAPERSKSALDAMKRWLIANNGAVTAVVFLILGLKLAAAGAQGLFGG